MLSRTDGQRSVELRAAGLVFQRVVDINLHRINRTAIARRSLNVDWGSDLSAVRRIADLYFIEEIRHGSCEGAGSGAGSELHGITNRAQQVGMGVEHAGVVSRFHLRPNNQGGDVPAAA